MKTAKTAKAAKAAHKNSTEKKMTGAILAVILLSLCLCFTTFALIWATVSVENNLFHTGSVKIDLNGGKPVIEEREFLFEPGMTVEKNFTIENQSTYDVWYRLYFDKVEGGLADVLEITLRGGDRVIWRGKLADMTKERTAASADALKLHETKTLTLSFYFPQDAGNALQGQTLRFDLVADAVQQKNNPNRLFD